MIKTVSVYVVKFNPFLYKMNREGGTRMVEIPLKKCKTE